MNEREPIFNALFGLVSQGEGMAGLASVSWGEGLSFRYTSRRLRLWDDLEVQPALCQGEGKETVVYVPRLPPKHILRATWVVYHQIGAGSTISPAATQANNMILDALEAAVAPKPYEEKQTLGGLVDHVCIDGEIFKDSGDLDGARQSLMIVPLTILLP